MKPQTYLRLSLLLPYLLWVILLVMTQVSIASKDSSSASATSQFDVFWLASVYLIGALFWFLPYTVLAISLLLWSRNKQTSTMLRVFALAPVPLTMLMLLEINLAAIATGGLSAYLSATDFENTLALNGLAVGLTLVVGYLCVGAGYVIFRILNYLNVIREPGTEVQPAVPEAV